jgi:small neutral amino acid transporter SnatA (MarC family)
MKALAVCVLFMVGGRWLLSILGVGVADLLVAGGLVLLVLAVSDLVIGGGHEARGSSATRDIGAVPIETPLLAGPATLATTLLILVDRYGTLLAVLARGEPHCRLAPVLSRAGSQKNRFIHCTAYYRSLQRFAIAVRIS